MTKRIVGIAGSLRARSFNRRLLEAAAGLAPAGVELEVRGLDGIPLFNEDLEEPGLASIPAVRQFRAAIEEADAVLIATPEYNQSMPGVLKNAIDWASRPPRSSFSGKPVALLGVTTGEWGTRLSQAALRQTLFACGAQLVQVPHLYLRRAEALLPEGQGAGPELQDQLGKLLAAIAEHLG